MKKRPKFFCESCGTEVKQNDKFCFHCGKFFSSVKCPSCGFSGDSPAFRDGCPACGYAVFMNGRTGGGGQKTPGGRRRGKHEIDPLPPWMYLVTLLLTVALIIFILLRK